MCWCGWRCVRRVIVIELILTPFISLLKIQQEREREGLIQKPAREREGGTQNPARQRERDGVVKQERKRLWKETDQLKKEVEKLILER